MKRIALATLALSLITSAAFAGDPTAAPPKISTAKKPSVKKAEVTPTLSTRGTAPSTQTEVKAEPVVRGAGTTR